eukprot:CAMPEP_0185572476 /NCGR_PEP_ID=MMETSP0434-20130131/4399_1 /TAXON_ID=626734 ORGANISM="Favella taraikaensis, Strain Fe Narragansett Bay" /NCGR_SAMPLE_ID=MMETSP0434 /ASSEMBLY_ACC=CAM_ASM_000379 /LENGTH=561 /DNA_ID=CAMNT_0028188359 /DNA_START=23 /DNA_END=1704 /DNA_ORIENTATION=+
MRACVSTALLLLASATAQSCTPTTVCDPAAPATLDGCCNNVENPTAGALGQTFRRLAPAAYPGDGSGDTIASTSVDGTVIYRSERVISNAVFAQTGTRCSDRDINEMHTFFGQFSNHDSHKASTDSSDAATVTVPFDDAHFTMDMPVSRSNIVPGTGVPGIPREQANDGESSQLDLSVVYGLNDEWLAQLRTDGGTGAFLIMNDYVHGEFPPPGDALADPSKVDVIPDTAPATGDVRAPENPGLLTQHTIWARNHNYWARRFRELYTVAEKSDEDVFQLARRLNIAELQHVTVYEWLPALGVEMPRYPGYNPTLLHAPVSEMVVGALRFGHSQLRDNLEFADRRYNAIRTLELKEAFFTPDELTGGLLPAGGSMDVDNGGTSALLRGQVSRCGNRIDAQVVDAVRNFLFGEGAGLDLVSFNLFRARDWGIPRYNVIREAVGLSAAASFADITDDADVQAALASVYDSVDDVDFWVGGLAEDHGRGKAIGPMFEAIFLEHFRTVRDGDRFWYENPGSLDARSEEMDNDLRRRVRDTDYGDIVARNSPGLRREDVPRNVFFVR